MIYGSFYRQNYALNDLNEIQMGQYRPASYFWWKLIKKIQKFMQRVEESNDGTAEGCVR